MITNNVITINELCKKYKKSRGFFTTLLCRPEFNKFKVQMIKIKFAFEDCLEFHKIIFNFINNRRRCNKYIEIEKPIEFIEKWTETSLYCYKRKCCCDNCKYSKLSTKCKMRETVFFLIEKIGIPQVGDS